MSLNRVGMLYSQADIKMLLTLIKERVQLIDSKQKAGDKDAERYPGERQQLGQLRKRYIDVSKGFAEFERMGL